MVLKTRIAMFLFLVAIKIVPAQTFVVTDKPPQPDREFKLRLSYRLDSLRATIAKHSGDTMEVNALIEYGSTLRFLSNDSAQAVLEEALRLAEKLKHYRGQTELFSQLGGIAQEAHQYDKAIAIYKQSYELAESQDLINEMLEGYRQILNLYFYLGNFSEAMELSTRGLQVGERLHNRAIEAYYKNLIGFIYLRQSNLENAEKYYRDYFQLAHQLSDSMMIADAYSNLGEVFMAHRKPHDALVYFFNALHLYERLDARGELWKQDRLAFTLFKVGCAYNADKDFQQGLQFCLRAIDRSTKTPSNKYDLASFYIHTGDTYRNLNNLTKAIPYLNAGLQLSRQIQHNENIRDAYHALSVAYADKKQFDSAYRYQTLYAELERKIVNANTRKEIEQVNAAYAIEKKDREIAHLQEQKAFSENEASQQRLLRNAIILLMIFLIVLIYLVYNRYRLKQKNRFQAELNQHQNRLFHTITTFQDQERKRIAQDIHDSLGSILSAAKLRLSGMESAAKEFPPDQRENYAVVVSLLDEAVSELRNISHNIMPATLSRLGLEAALRNLFEKISSFSTLKIHYNAHGLKERFREELEIMIYRIVLELVNNVVKHAQATDITIQLVGYADHVNVTVEDNGKGFNVSRARTESKGLGLANIFSRIESVNGKIEIDSSIDHGAIVMLDIPLT